MAALHGTIGEFNSTQETWQSYVERVQQYFVANDVTTPEKQWAVLLSAVGGPTYQLIRNILAPTKLKDKSIVAAVRSHHDPRPSVIVQRFTFHSRNRRSGENVSTHIAKLRKLSEHCKFGNTLNDMRIICGIADQQIQ